MRKSGGVPNTLAKELRVDEATSLALALKNICTIA